MPSGEAAALIAGASAVGGGAIVAVSNYAVGVLQARGRTVRFINEQMARLPQIDYTIGRARRRLFEPHLDAFAIELAQAMTAASMPAPLRLLPSPMRCPLWMPATMCGESAGTRHEPAISWSVASCLGQVW